MPRYGPPKAIGLPSDCPSATTMSAPYSPGRFRIPRLIGSTLTVSMAPLACTIFEIASTSSRAPKKFGCCTSTLAVSEVRLTPVPAPATS